MLQSNSYILGTAQLGMPYGIANTFGKPEVNHAVEIIATTLTNGIVHFDTAQGYGDSEKVLGEALSTLKAQSQAKIITKLGLESLQDKALLENALNTSLNNLNVASLYCLMLHHEECLSYLGSWQGDCLQMLREKKKFKYIGVSVYTLEKALQALEHPLVHIIQVPSSFFDKRFIKEDFFRKATALGKEVHIRSVFLQGVLCMLPENLPAYLAPLKCCLQEFHSLCDQYSCTSSQAALTWIRHKAPDALLIFGVESAKQLLENIDTDWLEKIKVRDFLCALEKIEVPQEVQLLNPSLWKV